MLWWTDDLQTGIYMVDEQHRNMFDKANEIFDLGIDADINEVKRIFIFLMEYSNNHFHDEEKLMIQEEYKGFIKHRNEHNKFIDSIYRIYENISNKGITDDNLNDLKVLIIEWLANHINGEDKDFIKHYSKK